MSSRRARSGGSITAPADRIAQQRRIEATLGCEVAELLAAGADENRVVLLELGQNEREPFLLGFGVAPISAQ